MVHRFHFLFIIFLDQKYKFFHSGIILPGRDDSLHVEVKKNIVIFFFFKFYLTFKKINEINIARIYLFISTKNDVLLKLLRSYDYYEIPTLKIISKIC